MNTAKASEKIKEKFANAITGWEEKNPKRVYFQIPPASLRELTRYAVNELGLRFIIASGTDTRRTIEILYHFADDNSGAVITARIVLPDKKNLKIDSIGDIFVGAMWIEREIHELLGVAFTGNDDLRHLLLNDDWPKNNFPLRHDNDR